MGVFALVYMPMIYGNYVFESQVETISFPSFEYSLRPLALQHTAGFSFKATGMKDFRIVSDPHIPPSALPS